MNINGVQIDPDKLYTPSDVSTALGFKTATLAAYRCREGGIPFLKIGRGVFYRGKDLIDFLDGCKREPGADPARSERAREIAARRIAKAKNCEARS